MGGCWGLPSARTAAHSQALRTESKGTHVPEQRFLRLLQASELAVQVHSISTQGIQLLMKDRCWARLFDTSFWQPCRQSQGWSPDVSSYLYAAFRIPLQLTMLHPCTYRA